MTVEPSLALRALRGIVPVSTDVACDQLLTTSAGCMTATGALTFAQLPL